MGVEMVRRRDDDRVDVVRAEERLPVGDGAPDAEVLRDHARLLGVVIADGHDFGVTALLQTGKVIDLGDEPDADHAETEGSFFHDTISGAMVTLDED
jgi:hypothetical protein